MSSISNNSNIPLPAGGSFNGLYELLSDNVESVQINVKSDVQGTLRVFFGITPSVLLYEQSYTYIPTSQYFFISFSKKSRYFRVEYTNNPTTAQSYFELRTTYNDYLNIEEPGTSGVTNVNIVSSTGTIQTNDATGNSALSQIYAEVLDIKNEVLNPTSIQPVTGTIYSKIIDIANTPQTFTNVGLKNASDIYITNQTLDTHCYGSSDGTTWHHLKTNPTGVLKTNAVVESDTNGAITSTVNGTVNALDVQIKNSSIVAISQNANSQSVASSIFVSKPVDMTNPSSFYNVQIGSSVSTNGFLYGAGLVQITGYSASQPWIYPNIYIQQSPDNINWFDSSSASFNANGYYNIQIYNAVLYPYLRIYAKFDSISQGDFVSYSANAWIVQK